jgi:phosphate:Na+ symporter
MLGADIGTTLVAQIFAFDIKWLWALGCVVGVVLFNAGDSDRMKSAGRIAIGLGLMLLALNLIGSVSAAVRESATIKAMLGGLGSEPVVAVAVAALVTWLAHSSLAMVLFVMSLTATGVVTPTLALALVLGANIGGSIAPYMALSASAASARRVPLANLIARTAVAIAMIPVLSYLPPFVATFGADPARMVLNFHTLFNLAVGLIFLPLVDPLAGLAERIIPQQADADGLRAPQHLDLSVRDTPSEALACAMRETLNVGDIVLGMLRRSLEAFETTDSRLAKDLEKQDDQVDSLYEAIKLYLIHVSKADMSEAESRRYVEILTFTTNLEHVGDIIDKNLMELAQKKIKKRVSFSSEGLSEIRHFHGQVVDTMRLALNVFATRDVALARRLLQVKTAVRAQEFEAADRHFARLRLGRPESLETSSIHLDIIRDLKRINSHLTSVAYPILEAAGELRDSRLKKVENVVAGEATAASVQRDPVDQDADGAALKSNQR